MSWRTRVSIKHLFTRDEDHQAIQASMTAIAEVLQSHEGFRLVEPHFWERMRNIPAGDDIITPVDYANRLLDRIYDYADNHRIWIE